MSSRKGKYQDLSRLYLENSELLLHLNQTRTGRSLRTAREWFNDTNSIVSFLLKHIALFQYF